MAKKKKQKLSPMAAYFSLLGDTTTIGATGEKISKANMVEYVKKNKIIEKLIASDNTIQDPELLKSAMDLQVDVADLEVQTKPFRQGKKHSIEFKQYIKDVKSDNSLLHRDNGKLADKYKVHRNTPGGWKKYIAAHPEIINS